MALRFTGSILNHRAKAVQIQIFMSDLQTSTPNTESFAALFEESLTKQDMRAGEVISAEVVRVDHNFVVVNAGLKSEAYIPLEEFLNDAGSLMRQHRGEKVRMQVND
jgi:small subunit ribosomal protein S1